MAITSPSESGRASFFSTMNVSQGPAAVAVAFNDVPPPSLACSRCRLSAVQIVTRSPETIGPPSTARTANVSHAAGTRLSATTELPPPPAAETKCVASLVLRKTLGASDVTNAQSGSDRDWRRSRNSCVRTLNPSSVWKHHAAAPARLAFTAAVKKYSARSAMSLVNRIGSWK